MLVRRHDISLADLSRDQFFAQHYHILHDLEPQRVIVDRPARKVILLVLLVAAVFLNGMPAKPRIIAQRLRARQEALKVLFVALQDLIHVFFRADHQNDIPGADGVAGKKRLVVCAREHHGVFRVPAEIQHIHRHTAAEVDHAALVNRYKLRVFAAVGKRRRKAVFVFADLLHIVFVQIYFFKSVDAEHVVAVRVRNRNLDRQPRQLLHGVEQVALAHARVDQKRLVPALNEVARRRKVVIYPPKTGLYPRHFKLRASILL